MFPFGESATDDACACEPSFDGETLTVDADACPGAGAIATEPACRETVVAALRERSASAVRIERRGVATRFEGEAAALLAAAGAFAARVAGHDAVLAERVLSDPVSAAADATGRVGPVAELAAETGLAGAAHHGSVADALRGAIEPTIAAARLDPDPPSGARLRSTEVLDSGATVRVYDGTDGVPVYHVEPLEYALGTDAFGTLAAAWSALADRPPSDRAAHDAVAAVAGPDQPLAALGRALDKHARGYGILDDLFSDPRVGEVYVNAPADETPIQVRSAGETMRTNVRLTERGADLLASRVRMESGTAFSRADPTIDALLTDVGAADAVRVAGVQRPASDGLAFAFRAEATDEWRLSSLVDVGTLSAAAAGLLSLAMERGASILVAGPRGAGKTTLASSLLWELPPGERLLAIEDTPELPIDAIQGAGRDAQRLRAAPDDDSRVAPADALRTALRLGDGALAVGEVRGPEAAVLYEAMRVGAASSAVLGTIHGEGADGVRERVVSDLGVPESSFSITDLVVTIVPDGTARRVDSIEEITDTGPRMLFEAGQNGVEVTGRIDRGNSDVVASLARVGESYADVRAALGDRTHRFTDAGPRADAAVEVAP